MRKNKLVRELTLIIVIVFLSTSLFVPVRIRAEEDSSRRNNQAENKKAENEAEKLENEIKKAIENLSEKETELKIRLSQLAGVDITKTQAPMADLQKQLEILKKLSIGTTPTAEDLRSNRKTLMATRLEGWKDVTAVTKIIWQAKRDVRMWKKVALQLQNNINQTVTSLNKKSENIQTRMTQKQDKGLDVSAVNAPQKTLNDQITLIKAIIVPTDPTSGEILKTLQNNFQTAKQSALKAYALANKVLGSIHK